MNIARTLIGTLAVAVTSMLPLQASAGALEDAKAEMESLGAVILDGDYLDANTEITLSWNLPFPVPPQLAQQILGPLGPPSQNMAQFVDCLGNLSLDVCQNYANTAVTYGGVLLPGRDGQCNDATPPLVSTIRVPTSALPLPPIPGLPPITVLTIHFPLCAGIQLDEDEALVIYGTRPPTEGTYWGFQTSMYERHMDMVPSPEDREPMKPAENAPPATTPERWIISNDVGDTTNKLVINTAPDPDGVEEREVFIKVIGGNEKVTNQVINSFKEAGFVYDKKGRRGHVYLKPLPGSHVLSTDVYGDSYREILRIARPFDQDEFDDWKATTPIQPMRVSFPGINVKRFEEAVAYPTDRDTGEAQGDGPAGIAALWEQYVMSKYGTPDVTTVMNPRVYDDAFCEDSGSYCWGNNNDALYMNAMVAELDENGYPLAMQKYDLSGSSSRVVLTGIDHAKNGWATIWNWDIYNGEAIQFPGNPEFGSALETYTFTDAAEFDYSADKAEFCGVYPVECAEAGAEAVDALYWVQLRQTCSESDAPCVELCAAYEPDTIEAQICTSTAPSREIMHRVYLSPETATGPHWTNTRHNRIFYYQ